MRTLGLVLAQIRSQNRIFWRVPIGAFFTLVFPVMLLVLFVALFGNESFDTPYGEITTSQFYTPGLAVFAAASATYTNIGINLTVRRELGILKRVRGTPLPPWVYLAGVVGSAVWIALVSTAVMVGLGVLAYGVNIEAAKLPAMFVALSSARPSSPPPAWPSRPWPGPWARPSPSPTPPSSPWASCPTSSSRWARPATRPGGWS